MTNPVPSFRVDSLLKDIDSDVLGEHGASPKIMEDYLKGRVTDLVVDPENANLIAALIKENEALWTKYIKHPFVQNMAKDGSQHESSFKAYLKQDYYYLLNLIRFRAARLAKFRSDAQFHDLQAEILKISSAYDFAKSFRLVCLAKKEEKDASGNIIVKDDTSANKNIAWLPADLDSSEGLEVAVLGYNSFLQDRVSLEDWFTLYVATIPCIYGYALIASTLKGGKDYKKDTTFAKLWIEPNSNYKSSNKLWAFLNANAKHYESQATVQYWATIFKTALKFEIALFDSVTPREWLEKENN